MSLICEPLHIFSDSFVPTAGITLINNVFLICNCYISRGALFLSVKLPPQVTLASFPLFLADPKLHHPPLDTNHYSILT